MGQNVVKVGWWAGTVDRYVDYTWLFSRMEAQEEKNLDHSSS